MDDDFIKALINGGGKVYIVGGAIRNYIYNYFHNENINIADIDILVTNLSIKKIIFILNLYGTTKLVGVQFGVIVFKQYDNNKIKGFEIAIPREEYLDTNNNIQIIPNHNISIETDFSRRDATINAIGLQIHCFNDIINLMDINKNIPITTFIDPFNGITDIKNKLWKAIGEPTLRFKEDPIRIMRCFRQRCELNLSIECNTLVGIYNNYNLLRELIPKSFVRIFDEFLRMLQYDNFYNIISIMMDTYIF